MYRKWKKTAALGLAVLIGGMLPMGTMMAAENNTEVAQEMEADSVSDADEVCDDKVVSDENESVDEEVKAEEENAVDEELGAEEENIIDEVIAEDENAADEADTVDNQNIGIEVMAASDVTEAGDTEDQENTGAPVIDITLNGENCKVDGLGGDIEYKYFNYSDVELAFSASQNGTKITFSYYLDNNPGDKAKDDIPWSGDCTSMSWTLSSNKSYVVYVKAEKDGQTVYARSCGIVVDTIAPEIVGLEAGKTYPEGTTFKVEDANLDVVMVNGTPVTPESDGNYRVKANGTSCVIKAIDKAKNENNCSVTVFGGETPGTGDETPETDNIISKSGVYTLKAGVKYHLAEGKWKVDGDKSVYQGDSDFYVKSDGDYKFKK